VIFVAHAGLDTILALRDVRRRFPVGQLVRERWRQAPPGEVPRSALHEVELEWLYDWWQRSTPGSPGTNQATPWRRRRCHCPKVALGRRELLTRQSIRRF
jgi:hypothetical protein